MILLGYAAQLADGARRLKIHGRYVPVRAEVTPLGGEPGPPAPPFSPGVPPAG